MAKQKQNLPEAINDREEWWERVRDIRAGGTTRYWYVCLHVCLYRYTYVGTSWYLYRCTHTCQYRCIDIVMCECTNIYEYVRVCVCIYRYTYVSWPSQIGLQNTPTASLQRVKTLSMNVMIWHERIWWWVSSNAWGLGMQSTPLGWCPHGVMVKAMDCGFIVSDFVLQSRYYVHFLANTLGKGMNSLILPAMG